MALSAYKCRGSWQTISGHFSHLYASHRGKSAYFVNFERQRFFFKQCEPKSRRELVRMTKSNAKVQGIMNPPAIFSGFLRIPLSFRGDLGQMLVDTKGTQGAAQNLIFPEFTGFSGISRIFLQSAVGLHPPPPNLRGKLLFFARFERHSFLKSVTAKVAASSSE